MKSCVGWTFIRKSTINDPSFDGPDGPEFGGLNTSAAPVTFQTTRSSRHGALPLLPRGGSAFVLAALWPWTVSLHVATCDIVFDEASVNEGEQNALPAAIAIIERWHPNCAKSRIPGAVKGGTTMQELRQQRIMDLARQAGRVSVADLATHFGVSPQTIRSDLKELAQQKLLDRTHGGASIASSVQNLAYEARRKIAENEKREIGRATAALIPANSSLFLNIGTTTEEVGHALKRHTGLLLITNNLHVATMLYPYEGIDVVISGGAVRRSDGGVVGSLAVDLIRQFKVDFAIIGVSAIDADGTLLDFDLEEIRVAQAIMANARTAVLVADSSKFDRLASARIGHLRDIDIFVTNRVPSSAIKELCEREEVRIIETEVDQEPTIGPDDLSR